MYKLICIFFVMCSTVFPNIAYSLDKQAAKQFEQIANTAFGVISTFHEEIRTRRSQGMQHKITISDDAILTIQFSFPCHPLPEEGQKGKEKVAKSYKQFFLGDFSTNPLKRYEINHHLNTMSFFDQNVAWVIAFKTKTDLQKAENLFEKIIQSVSKKPSSQMNQPSQLAKECGFRYVVFAPRTESIENDVRLLNSTEHPSNLLCWLTKKDPSSQEILNESNNALPLFFYDLSLLDETSFFTVSSPGMSSFYQCSLGNEVKQSAFFDDEQALQSFFLESPFVGIRFKTLPTCTSPKATLFYEDIKKLIHKGQTRGIDIENSQQIHMIPTYTDSEIPTGTNSCWFTGINSTSDDIFRYILLKKELTRALLTKIIYKEFPESSTLLKIKSHFRKDFSLEDAILSCSKTISLLETDLSQFSQRVLRVAGFTHELGAPFSNDNDLFYNTWPLALSIAEKTGLQENEIHALKLLLQEQPPVKVKEEKELSFLLKEGIQANEIGISLGEWITLKMSFYFMLAKQFKSTPTDISTALKKLQSVKELYFSLLNFGLPLGTTVFKGVFPTRHLFSTYLWESLDTSHRDGLFLRRRRDKFERMLIEKPKSPWKGRFWDWLNKENEKIYPNIYLTEKQSREPYKAIFEQGVLISPSFSEEEVEVMFVVDKNGVLYVGEKKEASSPENPGFSHASFLAGEPVASAGKMTIKNHHIISITNHSGHYRPGPQAMKLILEILNKHGVDTSEISTKKLL